ncbi:MAG: glycine zipper 2TM domain-containing protein [Pseudomonadota bacterium]
MNAIQNKSRIHPLFAGAAVSVIVLSLVGTAAIAGWLPTSRGSVPPESAAVVTPTATPTALASSIAPGGNVQAAPQGQYDAPAPVHRPKRAHHATHVAQASPSYEERPVQQVQQQAPIPQPVQQAAPASPNYVGIGAGAVVGGLLGNQVGGGRGKALATVAGVIGGGFLGNEIQNRVQQPAQQPQR